MASSSTLVPPRRPLAMLHTSFGSSSVSQQRRSCISTIDPQEISFVEEVADGGQGTKIGPNYVPASEAPKYEDVEEVETFSRARVINFVKRYSGNLPPEFLKKGSDGSHFILEEVRQAGETIFKAKVRLPFPAEYGERYGEGLAATQKDAELLAAMHAEYIIDAFGFHIYTLSSMQKKHAEAALKAGRWAPGPDDGLREIAYVQLPPPLRRIADPDESEGGKYQMVDSRPLPFYHLPHTLLSPALVDPQAQQRIRNFFNKNGSSLEINTSVREIQPIDKRDSSYFEATIALKPLKGTQPRLAKGKGTDRNLAIVLACMHAELVIDACGEPLFPKDTNTQRQHAKAARHYGREVLFEGEKAPVDPILPPPLKLYVPSTIRTRYCARGQEEDFIHKNIMVAESATNFKNIPTEKLDQQAVTHIKHFLTSQSHWRAREPYLLEKIGTQYRATLVLPIDSAYGIRGGVGLAENPNDAQTLAAMHAIDVLCQMGIPVLADEEEQVKLIEKRYHAGEIVYPEAVDVSLPSPPAYRRVAAEGLARPNESSETPVSDEAAAAAASSAQKAFDHIARREGVDKSCWELAADTKDGYILVREAEENRTGGVKSYAHTILSPRLLDTMAKNRIINYLAFLGKRTTGTFSYQKLNAKDGLPFHRCIIRLPVPPQLGDRLSIGEAPEVKDAEQLACMHAELMLDTLGVPLYPNPAHQQKHAMTAREMGRHAPFPGDAFLPLETPTPPPLRMERNAPKAKSPTPSKSKAPSPNNAPSSSVSSSFTGIKPKKSKSEIDHIEEGEMDQNSKARIQNYLRRVVKVLPEPVISVSVAGAMTNHTAKMWLPVPAKFGQRFAIGMAERKKDADFVCYMHAERILDALGVHVLNLPGLQKRHVDRVKKEGRWAPGPGENPVIPVETETPPPIKMGGQLAKKLDFPVPNEFAWEDFTSWKVHIQQCEEYLEAAHQQYETETYDKDMIPRTGDPFMDATIGDVENAGGTDPHSRQTLQNYCFQTNTSYPKLWKSQAVGPINSRRALTTIPVPGYEHITASGVALSKDNSQRRAAMHALAILRRIDPEFASIEAAINTVGGPTGSAPDGTTGASMSARQNAQRDFIIGSWDRDQNQFTNDGKVRILELFTICFGLNPPITFSKQRMETTAVIQQTIAEVVDEEGTKWQGRADDAGSRKNEVGAYNDLFQKMSRGLPSFQNLMALARTHPHLTPETIVDLSIPPAIQERMEVLVEGITEEAAADAASPEVSVDVTTEKLVEQTDLTSDKMLMQERSADLIERHEARMKNEKYISEFHTRRTTLSIWDKKEELMDAIHNNSVTVICGTTGCGKTTQLPQYILDYETSQGRGGDCSIIVTQPRRISAVSIAQRVAAERLEEVGDVVGYTIRLDSIPGKHINFITSGVLLRIFQAKPELAGIKYVIIDEIHERDINSDFLLILMRELSLRRPDLRIILMSATLQSELFSSFFRGAPVVNVEGYVYPVKEMFLEDIARIADEKNESALIPSFKEYSSKEDDPMLQAPEGENWNKFKARGGAGSASMARPRYGFMEANTEIDYGAVQYAINHIVRSQEMTDSSVLVFLPGWDEIIRAKEIIDKNPKYHLLLLHSSVNADEQLKCFEPAPEGKVKIILSTNIAESGVTIDDIKGVVDVGRAKEKSFVMRKGRTNIGKHEMGQMSQLVTVYASRANCIQRRGRAGRTREGMCIRLYTKNHFDTVAEFQTPEMLRQPLDSLCLQILALGLGDPGVFLNKALEPPSVEAVEAAMHRLEDLGAINPTRKLTPLGLKLSKLPVAPRVGKVILMGAMLRCLDSALTIASTVEVEVFNASRDVREATRIQKEHLSNGTQSDHIGSLNAYNMFTAKCAENGPIKELQDHINENGFFIPSLRVVSRYKKQFFEILAQSGFLGKQKTPKYQVFVDTSSFSDHAQNVGLVKAILVAGFFPNVAMYRGKRLMRNKFENLITPSTASVLHRTSPEEVKNPYFVYEEMVRSAAQADGNAKVNVRGISAVSLWSILLMGASNSQVAYRDDMNLGLVDDWLVFRASFDNLDLLKRFKALLSKTMIKKLSDPEDEDNSALMDKVADIVRELVSIPTKPNQIAEGTWEEIGRICEAKPWDVDRTLEFTLEAKSAEEEAKAAEEAKAKAAADTAGTESALKAADGNTSESESDDGAPDDEASETVDSKKDNKDATTTSPPTKDAEVVPDKKKIETVESKPPPQSAYAVPAATPPPITLRRRTPTSPVPPPPPPPPQSETTFRKRFK